MDNASNIHLTVLPSRAVVDRTTADFFGVLASPIRLAVVRLLLEGERCVSDLVGILGIAQPRLSNHLACLRRCGVVTVRRQGLFLYYALADPQLGDLVRLATTLAEPRADALRTCPVVGEERQS